MKKGKGKKGSLTSSDAGVDQYRLLFENAGDPIFIHDENRIFAVNNKACEFLGYTREELLSMGPSDVDTPEERVKMPGRMAKLKLRGTLTFETIHRRKDGSPIHVDVTAQLISWDGKPAIMGICKDASRRKHAENILLTTALEWQNTFDSIKDAIFLLDNDFRILRCNRAASDKFRRAGKDIIGKYCWEVVHETDKPIPECPLVRMQKSRKREIAVLNIGERWLEVTVDPILDDEGEVCGAIHVVSDLTELKKIDRELETSQERFRMILEGANEGILIADIRTKDIKYSNPAMCRILGYGAGELRMMNIRQIHPESDWPFVLSEFESQSRGEKVFSNDIPCLSKDGRKIYADINTTRIMFDGSECNVGFFRDVTERKKAFQEVNDSRLLYQDIIDNQAAGIYRIRVRKHEDWSAIDKPPYSYEFLNDRYCEITGASREQHIADPSLTMKLVHPDDLKRWIDDNTTSDRTLSPFMWEGRLLVNGNVKWVHFESRPRELANTDRVWTGILLDISDRKMVEEGLKQSLSLLNATVESTADGILVIDNNGRISYSNSRFAKMWDIPDEIMARGDNEKAIQHVLQQLKDPDLFVNKLKYLFAHPEEDSFDIIEFKDGKIFERYSHAQRIGGQPVGRVWSFRDVTLARKAAESISSGDRKYRSLVETTNTGYVVIDTEGRVADANQEYVRMTGRKELKEILGRNVVEWTAPHEMEKNAEAVSKCAREGQIRNFEIEYVDRNGKITPIEINATVLNTDEGPRILTLCRDITERRRTEKELEKTNKLLGIAQKASKCGFWTWDIKSNSLTWSKEFYELFELSPETGASFEIWKKILHPDDIEAALDKIDSSIRNRMPLENEYRIVLPGGREKWIAALGSTIYDDSGQPSSMSGLCIDISDRKKAEEELKRHRDHLEDLVEERSKELKESERKYRELVENTNSIILRMDRTGVITFFNEFSQKFFGFSEKEARGRNVVGLIVPEVDTSGEDLKEMILSIGREPEKYRNNVNENTLKNGERVWIAWTNTPVFDEKGQVAEILCVGNNITERVKAEKELEKYRGRLEELVEERTDELISKEKSLSNAQRIAHLGSWSRDLYTDKLKWSDEVCRIFGFEQGDDVTYENFAECIHPDDLQAVKDAQENAIAARKPSLEIEYRIIPRNSSEIRNVSEIGEFVFDEAGKLVRIDGVVQDITERRRAESALLESEERFKKIVEQSPMSMAVVAMDGTIEFINKKSVETFGYLPEDIPTMREWWLKAYPDEKYREEVVSTWMGLVKEAMDENHEIRGREYRVTCKNGAVKTIFIFGVPVSNKIFVMFDDITERKTIETQLVRSEEKYRRLHESMTDAFVLVDMNGYVKEANKAFLDLIGYPEDELMQKKYTDLTPGKWHGYESDMVKVQVLARGYSEIYEKEYIRKDGTVIPVEIRTFLIRDEKGEPAAMWAIVRDLTERKRTEQALKDSEEKFRTLFENSKDALMTVAPPSWKFTSANPAIADMFGVSGIEEFIRHAPWELSPEYQPDGSLSAKKAMEMINIAVRDGYNFFEWTHRRLNTKEDFPATVLLSRINIKGQIVLQATVRDISEQKKAERERERLEDRLRQSEKMEAIGQLAGGIAHDFNNQLMGIMGYAEILADRLEDEEMRKDAESILRSSRRAADLTKDLLAFARKGKYQAIPVNVHKVIEEVISLLTHSIDKRIEIRRELRASPALIMGDPTQIQNVLLNLGINARDAMPEGGVLSFTTEVINADGTYLNVFQKFVSKRCLKICVIDNGIGMDSETMKHLFEPFFTTKSVGKGTGMGLASVYGTINSHNGIIDVRSEPGKGSEFMLYFPLLEEAADYSESRTASSSAIRQLNILLVDDEEIVRSMVAKMLRSAGHKVFICKDGQEALNYYRQSWQNIDLVILDMMMPRMNGRDSFIGMKAVNPNIVAILMSGYSIDGEVQSLLDAGMRGFIQKPFNTRELNNAIEEAACNGKK